MADAGRRRDDAEVVEGLLAPAQEGVALAVALVVAVGVDVEGARGAERVDLDRVVDDEVDRDERVDLRRVRAELVDRVAHRRQVDDRRHAGEVLHQHPRRLEGDLVGGLGGRVPGGDRLDVGRGHRVAVLEPQRVLEQDLERVRKPGDVELLLQRVEAEDLVLATRRPTAWTWRRRNRSWLKYSLVARGRTSRRRGPLRRANGRAARRAQRRRARSGRSPRHRGPAGRRRALPLGPGGPRR